MTVIFDSPNIINPYAKNLHYLLDKLPVLVYTIGMRYTPPAFTRLNDMAAIDVGRLTEDQARSILEAIRWPNGPECPHCGGTTIVRIQSLKVRDGLLRCKTCRKQFTVTVGTVLERSHITLRQWLQALYSMSAHKKGVSALQLQRDLDLKSYESAWFLAHRIRLAMQDGPFAGKLQGTVEVDETYVGGKPDPRSPNYEKPKRGRGTKKTPVLALIQRGGKARSFVVGRVDADNLKQAIREHVDASSTIMTDEFRSYTGIGKEFKGGHKAVNHGKGQYSRGRNHQIHVNNAESYFAILKRGVHGTFHSISKNHLPRYCDEFAFRWSNRDMKDGNRAVEAVKGIQGKRLMYDALVGRG